MSDTETWTVGNGWDKMHDQREAESEQRSEDRTVVQPWRKTTQEVADVQQALASNEGRELMFNDPSRGYQYDGGEAVVGALDWKRRSMAVCGSCGMVTTVGGRCFDCE